MPEVKIFKILLLLHNMGTKIDEKLWLHFLTFSWKRSNKERKRMILLAIQTLCIVQIALFDSWQNLVNDPLY